MQNYSDTLTNMFLNNPYKSRWIKELQMKEGTKKWIPFRFQEKASPVPKSVPFWTLGTLGKYIL